MAEHGMFPPASLQSNDAPKVFSLTLTTAYKRDQFLPSGQHKEMEFFITEWRWEQRVWRKIKNEPWAPQAKMKLRYTRKPVSSSAKLQLSGLVAAAEMLWVLWTACSMQLLFFSGVRRFTQWSVNVFQSVLNVWVSCVSPLRDILRPVFLKISGSSAGNAWKRLKDVQLSEPNTDRVCQCDSIWMLKINTSQNSRRKKTICYKRRVRMETVAHRDAENREFGNLPQESSSR